MRTMSLALILSLFFSNIAHSEVPSPAPRTGDQLLAEYFRNETATLRDACLRDVQSADDWQSRRDEYRRQLHFMLGLQPLPERTDLKPVITGTLDHAEFIVEKLHFQSLPGLYVTGNLYRPKQQEKPAPGILYVCGHGRVVKNNVSLGNKTHYQHHGAWLARNGYVCLVIDTIQLGEIEGVHHGTYKLNQWWWVNRGYTPAGVEAWNCIRALDYLQSRPEVDGQKLGVTGRSGGGAYSWWIAALDERIKCAVPVAGITDLEDHVVDGCVEGHCDCMYMVNAYRWDYPQVAALVAPRPLLIANTDTDPIFPLDGVVRTFDKVRRVYRLLDASPLCGLNITAGGHIDTQELQVHALRWFDQHLRGEKARPIETAATKFFEPERLKVFDQLPTDERNTKIQESFVPLPEWKLPAAAAAWETERAKSLERLRQESFRGWPKEDLPLNVRPVWSAEREGVQLAAYDFVSQQPYDLRLYVAQRSGVEKLDLIVLNVLDDAGYEQFVKTWQTHFAKELNVPAEGGDEQAFAKERQMFQAFQWGMAYIAPRGVGPTAFDQSEKKQTQNRRRFYLLGQTLDGMQAWDVRRGMQAVRSLAIAKETPLWLQAEGPLAGVALYASLFEPPVKRLDLHQLPATHRQGPFFLNVERIWNMPQAVAAAAERSTVVLYGGNADDWKFPQQVAATCGWDAKRLQIRPAVSEAADKE